MGFCTEFGPHIRDNCDGPTVAGYDAWLPFAPPRLQPDV